MLRVGAKAPNFILPDDSGRDVVMDEFRGRWVLVLFYPADFSPVCTRQACALRDAAAELERRGVAVVGINFQKPDIHKRFREEHRLAHVLLWDRQKRIARRYGAQGAFGLYCKRAYFLLDPEGWIVYRRVEPLPFMSRSIGELLAAIDKAQAAKASENGSKRKDNGESDE